MRKALRRIFLLCVALIVCMQGLCLAYVSEETWMEFWEGNWTRFDLEAAYPPYLDMDSVKAREYNGRKYLELMLVAQYYQDPFCRFHMLLDIEHQKEVRLGQWALVITNDKVADKRKYKYYSQDTSYYADIPKLQDWTMERERQLSSKDISAITEARSENWTRGIEKEAIQWVEQNRPDVIDEIRTFNHSGQSAGTTNVTGAANATGDMTPPQYDITDSGVVKYTMRADTHDSVKAWTSPGGPDYYIVKMSDSLRAKKSKWEYTYPGDYIIAYWEYPHQRYVKHTGDTWEFSEEYSPEEEQDKELRVYKTFSYDPATDMFTFYSGDFYEMRMRVIDRNTIYVEDLQVKEGGQPANWKAEWTAVFNYVDYNSLTKPHKEYADFHDILVYMDDGIWFPDHKCEMAGSTCYQNLFSACVDMALAFKAVKGQIGELPDGYEFTEW